jgi:hypothetical protein
MFAILPVFLLAAAASEVPPPDSQPTGRVKTFIAPSGEPFRVYGDAPYPLVGWFQGADKNGDGKLDLAEFTADFLRFFDQLDANHDGAIDGIERTHYENEVAPETLGSSWSLSARRSQEAEDVNFGSSNDGGAATIKKAKPLYGSNPIGAARFDLLGLPEPVAAMDVEVRGRVSRRQAEQVARDRFNLLDPEHLGYLTLDTLPPTFSERDGGKARKGKRG